jgi:hypothetical protein
MIDGWSITLGWRDILNIVLAALAVIQFVRNRRTKQDSREVLQRQAVQTAAHGFAEMSKIASELETWVGRDEWERSLELAKRLMVSLAEASGAWSATLETNDVDNFDAARSEIRSVEKSVSLAAQGAPSPEKREEMKQQCMNAAIYMAAIAGRLKRPGELKEARGSIVRTLMRRVRGGQSGLSEVEVRDLKESAKEVVKS